MKSTKELKALEENVKMQAKAKVQSRHIRDEVELKKALEKLTITLTMIQESTLEKVSGNWLLSLYIYEAWEEALVKVDPSISIESIEHMLKDLNLVVSR